MSTPLSSASETYVTKSALFMGTQLSGWFCGWPAVDWNPKTLARSGVNSAGHQ